MPKKTSGTPRKTATKPKTSASAKAPVKKKVPEKRVPNGSVKPPSARSGKVTLRAARIAANIKQRDLAAALDTSRDLVSNYERGVTVPSPDRQVLIAKTLKVPKDSIVYGVATEDSQRIRSAA